MAYSLWMSMMTYFRAFHKLLEISQTFPVISQKVAQKSQKLLFVKKVAQKFLRNRFCFCLLSFGLMQKHANFTAKVEFLSIFVQFCVATSVTKNFVLNWRQEILNAFQTIFSFSKIKKNSGKNCKINNIWGIIPRDILTLFKILVAVALSCKI